MKWEKVEKAENSQEDKKKLIPMTCRNFVLENIDVT